MRLSTLKELLTQIDEICFESSNGTTLTDRIQITEVSESQKKFLIAEQRFEYKV